MLHRLSSYHTSPTYLPTPYPLTPKVINIALFTGSAARTHSSGAATSAVCAASWRPIQSGPKARKKWLRF